MYHTNHSKLSNKIHIIFPYLVPPAVHVLVEEEHLVVIVPPDGVPALPLHITGGGGGS